MYTILNTNNCWAGQIGARPLKGELSSMNIYVASSWRNERQQEVVFSLRQNGHDVYDFKNPTEGNRGFHWSDIDKDWKKWTPDQFKKSLSHPIAISGFSLDWNAMVLAKACVLVMPCGRSAHLEAGFFVGAFKPLFILLSDGEPELMYKMATGICSDIEELLSMIAERELITPYSKIGGM